MTNSLGEQAKSRVRGFMGNEVALYIEGDLQRLITEIRPRRDGSAGLAVPLGLTCFSIMDYFGFLTREGSGVKKTQTTQNIFWFVEHWLPQHRLGCSPALLRQIFRNGMTHQFFAKASGIARGDSDAEIVRLHKGMPLLNVDALADTVLFALRSVEQAVAAANDYELALRMNQRLDQLAAEDRKELADLMNNR